MAEGIAKARANEHWKNDSGSALLSITGYNPEVERHDKNFADWAFARVPGYVSPVHKNEPPNFEEAVESVSKDEPYEAYLTMFVHYAPKIDGDMLLGEATDDAGGTLVNQVSMAVKRAIGNG